jgi:hypothetical protein
LIGIGVILLIVFLKRRKKRKQQQQKDNQREPEVTQDVPSEPKSTQYVSITKSHTQQQQQPQPQEEQQQQQSEGICLQHQITKMLFILKKSNKQPFDSFLSNPNCISS